MDLESEVAQSCPTLCNPMDSGPHQAPLFMGFSRQEYWSGLPFLSPWNLPDPGIEPRSPVFQANSLTSELPGKSIININISINIRYIDSIKYISIYLTIIDFC